MACVRYRPSGCMESTAPRRSRHTTSTEGAPHCRSLWRPASAGPVVRYGPMIRNARAWPVLLATVLSAAVLAQGTTEPPGRQGFGIQTGADRFAPVTDAMLESPDDGDWLMWRRTLNGWGYSPFSDINRGNVGALKLAWQH